MDSCCNDKQTELSTLSERHGRLLKVVLLINLLMFVVESVSGWLAHSTSLLADSLDMLGDAFVYAISLYAIGRGVQWGARVSLTKGIIMASFGLWILGQALYRFLVPVQPEALAMGWVGALALAANLTCAALLLRHRNDNINMRSTWLCSRNDVFANLGVLAAAALVAVTQTGYPDLIVGIAIAAMVLHSAFSILRESTRTMPRAPGSPLDQR